MRVITVEGQRSSISTHTAGTECVHHTPLSTPFNPHPTRPTHPCLRATPHTPPPPPLRLCPPPPRHSSPRHNRINPLAPIHRNRCPVSDRRPAPSYLTHPDMMTTMGRIMTPKPFGVTPDTPPKTLEVTPSRGQARGPSINKSLKGAPCRHVHLSTYTSVFTPHISILHFHSFLLFLTIIIYCLYYISSLSFTEHPLDFSHHNFNPNHTPHPDPEPHPLPTHLNHAPHPSTLSPHISS